MTEPYNLRVMLRDILVMNMTLKLRMMKGKGELSVPLIKKRLLLRILIKVRITHMSWECLCRNRQLIRQGIHNLVLKEWASQSKEMVDMLDTTQTKLWQIHMLITNMELSKCLNIHSQTEKE